MSLIGIIYETAIIIISALVSTGIVYVIYKDMKVALWAYVAAFVPRAIVVLVTLTGATNLGILTILSHTAGIIVYPMLLTMGNILMMEVKLAQTLKRQSSLPLTVERAIRIDGFINKLQAKKLLPNYVEVKHVYLAGVLAGIINLIFVFTFGMI